MHRKALISSLILCGSLVLSSCSVSPQQACSDMATAVCNKMAQCTQSDIPRNYGDAGVCVSRQQQNCLNALTAQGTGATPTTVEACAQAYASYDCESWMLNNPPAACIPQVGKLDAGTACSVSGQCQSTYCAVPAGVECGTCSPLPAVGDSCVGIGCGRGLICASNETCAQPVFDGGTCGSANPCAPTYDCVSAAGTTTGTCEPQVGTLGSACDSRRQTGASCEGIQNLACVGPRASQTCQAILFAGPGESCGYNADAGTFTQCSGAGACINADGGRTCVAPAADDAACDTQFGPPCLPPARCINGGVDSGTTAGICKFLTPSDCQ